MFRRRARRRQRQLPFHTRGHTRLRISGGVDPSNEVSTCAGRARGRRARRALSRTQAAARCSACRRLRLGIRLCECRSRYGPDHQPPSPASHRLRSVQLRDVDDGRPVSSAERSHSRRARSGSDACAPRSSFRLDARLKPCVGEPHLRAGTTCTHPLRHLPPLSPRTMSRRSNRPGPLAPVLWGRDVGACELHRTEAEHRRCRNEANASVWTRAPETTGLDEEQQRRRALSCRLLPGETSSAPNREWVAARLR
jgi:hypothetical protein